MTFKLPKLSFDKSALMPWLSAETFDYHYGKHHAAYVKKLNDAIIGTDFADLELEEIISKSKDQPAIFNNAAQHFNHSFFWNCLSPDKIDPADQMMEMINRDFRSFDEFKKIFSEKAATLFGSGWVWLILNDSKLEIVQYKNAETPAGSDKKPLLTLDVWEHAYYIDYRNDRAKFIEGFWDHVNWEFVDKQIG